MTTTLRPAQPLQRNSDGTRRRTYEVRVNSRRVGSLELATRSAAQPTVGVIRGLWIDEDDRRRGRGTVAALAAEEVLRSWRCTGIAVSVPADAGPALRMAASLGYRETGRIMVKELPAQPPGLPAGSVGRPMTRAEFDAWLEPGIVEYGRRLVAPGMTDEQGVAASRAEHARMLPDGPDTPGTDFLLLESTAGETLGTVWTGQCELPGLGAVPYVYDVKVAPEHRGQGHGRTLMLLAERTVLAAGGHRLGLHVVEGNTPARRLYESLGYRDIAVNASKELI
ncbi:MULTISPECIES: GNAT family N-acetyltransferase [unclassified Streptomyces]|uniref:GNAT family N-acetyltransferase n=1 Tax=unclassified Streptomyces TaxID=2593676 RepID=UPI0004C7AD73|nr:MULTISPECIES: GNAT family N-acetyltransferase [unclassified Streptomyces]KJY16098.1 acetyltransferase [Streptomyces sp. NRRL S-104]